MDSPSIADRIKQERIKRKLSATALAELAGVKPRKVKYYEERRDGGEFIPNEYLIAVARAMGLEDEYFFGDYHRFLADDPALTLNEFIRERGLKICEAEELFEVKEYALLSWRRGLSRIPYTAWCIIQGNKNGLPPD